jgi:rod shape-determining protein MreD
VRPLGALSGITLALALQTTLGRFLVRGDVSVDLVLVAVIYVALTRGPVGGMVAGSVAGLLQDSLAAPVVGIGGLAKAIVGFFAGAFAQQFIVTALLPRLVMFVAASLVHSAVLMGLYSVFDDVGTLPASWRSVAGQAFGNAVVGAVAFAAIEAVPGIVERRRLSRRGRH